MNIQTTELPKDVPQQNLEAERAVQAVAQLDEHVRPAHEHPGATGKDQESDTGKLGRKDAEKLLQEARDYFSKKGVNLNFRLLEDTKELQVEVVDARSHKVIRKIPEDEIVTLADNLKRMAKGVMDKAV